MITSRFLLILSIAALTACSSEQRLSLYKASKPQLDLFTYFDGCVKGWGQISNFSNEVSSEFVVDINGTIEGSTLTLDEHFLYSNGQRQSRQWNIEKLSNGTYRGTAADVVGAAVGRSAGNALHWRYQLQLPERDGGWVLTLDDWLHLQPNGVMLNKTSLQKFGLEVGELMISFQQQVQRSSCGKPNAPEWQKNVEK